jgi:O-antigen/teichoic acid export membrane protein
MSLVGKLKVLASHSAAIMLSRLAGAGIGFLTQILLVRLMGAHHLGLFYAASSLAAVAGVIAAQGYPQIAARFAGRYRNKQDGPLLAAFTGHAVREGLIAATVMAAGVTAWALLWPDVDPAGRSAYVIAGWMILAIVVLNILTNVAGGIREFALCYMPEGLVRPLAFFMLVAAAGAAGMRLTADVAMLLFAVITATLAGAVMFMLTRQMPAVRWAPASQAAIGWRWRSEAWQLILLAIFTNFFADVGILAVVPFLSSSDVAIFGLCLKLALLVGYFVQIGQQMVVPDMADARHKGDHHRLRRAAWRSIAVPTLITIFSMVVIYAFGPLLLSIFGPEFESSSHVLLILLAAQLLRALAGPSAHLLTLSGIQRINMGLALTSLVLLAGSSALLAPKMGVEGAALAVLITYAYWIGFSAVALRWLREPPVDALWLAIGQFRTLRVQA